MKKAQNNRFVVLLIFAALLVVSCKKGIPKELMQPSELENFLVDYHLAKAMGDELPYDKRYQQTFLIDYVYQKHHTDKSVFDSSMVYYTRHTEELSKIYDRVKARLKTQQGTLDELIALQENKPRLSPEGDSVDVWYFRRIHILNEYLLSNKLHFKLTTDSNYKSRDRIVWSANYSFMPSDEDSLRTDAAIMSLAIRFLNDSVLVKEKRIAESGVDSLELFTDSAYLFKEIKGFIYYINDDSLKRELLLNDVKLMRYHRSIIESLDVSLADSLAVEEGLPKETVSEKRSDVEAESIDALEVEEIIQPTTRKSPHELRQELLRSGKKESVSKP